METLGSLESHQVQARLPFCATVQHLLPCQRPLIKDTAAFTELSPRNRPRGTENEERQRNCTFDGSFDQVLDLAVRRLRQPRTAGSILHAALSGQRGTLRLFWAGVLESVPVWPALQEADSLPHLRGPRPQPIGEGV